MKQIIPILFVLFIIDAQSQDFTAEFNKKLDSQIEKYVEGVSPGMAVGVVKNSEIVYQKYIGYSNLENQTKINENTSFNIASNAKQFTALCILKLIEQGELKLDDDIRTYLPRLYKNIEYKITISNLLTHTSGIRDYCDLMALQGKTWWKSFIDNDDAIGLLESQSDLNFQPGTEHLYSNSNYILLTEIIKKITGQNFSSYAKSIFIELELSSTSFLTNYMAIIPNKARPYSNWGSWREYPSITEVHGDGALFTTLIDQLNWEQIIQNNNGKYISKQIIEKSQIPIAMDNGYGLMFDTYKGLKYAYHNGNTGAYNATFLRFPNEKLAIVVMSNNSNVPTNNLAKQLVDIVLKLENVKTEPSVYPANPDKVEKLKDLQRITGIYENEDGTIIRITEKDGSVYRELYQRDPVRLINEREGLFYYETIQDLKINFENFGKEDEQFTLYKSSQEPSTYRKISNIDMTDINKVELNGRYINNETDTEIILKHKEENSYSLTKNGRERNAELISPDYLRMMDVYKIEILRDEQNKVVGLNIDRGRIKNVIFKRM
ncbi:MAG: beta-lactamase family protein [Flavobacteriaceae bacterium]|nr:beta-lactamase family protein [Bacteroidia bacterium]NNL15286.1 beta-lactamase family protein [Flavobacteriaceae bacterium]